MMAGEVLLDAFINANILICVALALWFALRGVMWGVGLKHAYSTQIRLLNTVFLTVLSAPLIVAGFNALQKTGVTPAVKVNLSDIALSYYLKGGIAMKATDFEGLMQLRDTFLLNILAGAGLVSKILIAAFFVGLIIGLTRLVYSMFCLWRIVSGSYHWREIGRVKLRLSDRTLVPFSTRGLWSYYVVIPSHMLGQSDEMRVTLAHEFQHIRHGDLEWEIVLEALKPLFFLNPAYHAWKRQVEALREFNCDSQVLSKGRINAKVYCDTLLSICQKTLRRDRSFVIAVPKVTLVTADRSSLIKGKRSFLERRILSVLNLKRLPYERLLFAALAVPLFTAMALTSVAIQRPGDWSHDRLMLSTVVNLERLDEINRLSTFGRIRN
ncbi:MAG: M56 family metallopeptidase [Thalassococcus sp.]|uniref:M56 family metallopeptidase n=1 Tax=Thalassococcus sp. TaxID=1928858 RepID=UPI001B0C9652|nr:M56 family metallopeptidase [Thalassococcus sp.]MBO6868285.1 M56 family metallopeptidase [Thalassococcus sp.]